MATQDQEFIEYVVKNLVDHPEAVSLERSIDDRGVLLALTVDPDDMGKIIGKAGSTAKAIRTLLRVVGAKNDERLNLKIVDPEGDERRSQERAVQPEAVEGNTDTGVGADTSTDIEPSQTAAQPAPAPAADESIDEVEAMKAKARAGIEDLDMDI